MNSNIMKCDESALTRPPIHGVLLALCMLAVTVSAFGFGSGDVSVRLNGGGANNKAFIGDTNTLEILIRNDEPLLAMSTFFSISCATSYSWIKPFGTFPDDTFPWSVPIVRVEGDAVGAFDSIFYVFDIMGLLRKYESDFEHGHSERSEESRLGAVQRVKDSSSHFVLLRMTLPGVLQQPHYQQHPARHFRDLWRSHACAAPEAFRHSSLLHFEVLHPAERLSPDPGFLC